MSHRNSSQLSSVTVTMRLMPLPVVVLFGSLGIVANDLGCVSRPSPPTDATSVSRPSPPARATIPKKVEKTVRSQPTYPSEARHTLLRLARASLEQAVREGKHYTPPADTPANLLEKKGSFVTLTEEGQLRGCIGNIYPEMPLALAVTTNAYRAALNDPRFSPVTSEELARIEIEVSVLSVPAPLAFGSPTDLLQKLRPNVDGVVLKIGSHRSTFLPQVWEKLPDPGEFLDHLTAKAGLPARAWRGTETEIHIYQVEAFMESELERDAGK